MINASIPRPPYYKGKSFMDKLCPIVRKGIPKEADSRYDKRVIGTSVHSAFWEEEVYKIKNGVICPGVGWVPGRFYYYMNYKIMSTIRGVITPDMVDLHLELAYLIDYCKQNKHNLLCPKGRRKGISEAAHTMIVDWGWRFNYGYKAGVAAGNKTYVEDFISKWRFGDAHLPPELQVKKLVDNDDEIVAGYQYKNEQNSFVTGGTMNTIYARTMHTNPNMFKGLYLNDVISEEIGEHEKWFEFFNATKDALMNGSVQEGMFTAFGCVCAGTKVWDCNGNFVNIEDLDHKQGIIGFNRELGVYSKEHITYWQPPTEKMCYKITTNSGRTLECSEDHPILIRENYNNPKRKHSYKKNTFFVEAKDLKSSDSIAVIEEVDVWSEKRMFEPRIIGWCIGDGNYSVSGKYDSWGIKLFNADEEMYQYISSKYETKVDYSAPTKDGRTLRKFRINGAYLRHAFIDAGIVGQTKDEKRLPKDLHSYCKKDVCEVLGGYFDADGCVYFNDKTKEFFLKLTSANYEILNETRFILQKLGIKCNIIYEKPNFNNPKTTRGHYNLIIKDRASILKFHENISFWIKHKQKKFNRGVKSFKNTSCRKSGFMKGLRFEIVKSVECIGIKPIYNLTAGVTNTYVANGIVTHNTGGQVDKGSKDFKRISYEAETYNFIEFVIPATRFYFYGGATEENRRLPSESEYNKTRKPYELIGVEDLVLAEKHILERRKRLLDSGNTKDYNEDLQNNPLTKAEIFKKSVVNDFDINKLNAQQNEIDSQPKKYSKWKLEYVTDDKGTIKIPMEVKRIPAKNHEDESECVLILDTEPYRKGYRNLYCAGLDSYDTDTSKTSKSLGAMCVLIRENLIGDALKRAPVAVIRCRPRRKEIFYEMCFKLAIYYKLDGNVLVDIAKPLIIEHFKNRGGERYLAERPKKIEKIDSQLQHEFGMSINGSSKPQMVAYMQTAIMDYCQNIWFPDLINELGNYDVVEIGSDNDLADAYGIALTQDVSFDIKPQDMSSTESENDRFKLSWEKNIEGNTNHQMFKNGEMDTW